MTVVGVTGADGFLGWHLRARLYAQGVGEVRSAGRDTFASTAALDAFVAGCDRVLHIAGVNRGDAIEVESGNLALAQALMDSKLRTESHFELAFANSTQAGDDTPYGLGKQAAASLLSAVQLEAGDRFLNFMLPHLFGEHGRPFYNSGVTTFAHQIVTNGEPEILFDSELELLHAQDAAEAMIKGADDHSISEIRLVGKRIMVSEALGRLRTLAAPYLASGHMPELPTRFDVRLFNMLRSQLYPRHCPIPLINHKDHRGGFFETIRSHGKGQAAISTTLPGVTRGEHFHFDKVERFAVVQGEAIIRIRRLLFDDVHEYRVSGDEPVAVDMPTLHAHNITNTGRGELVTQFWTNDLFDPDNPDTVAEPV